MQRMESIEDFSSFRKRLLASKAEKPTLVVSAGTCGQASGANDLIRLIKRHIIARKANDRVSLRITGCLGFCEVEPFILAEPGGHLYPNLKMENVAEVLDATLEGRVAEGLVYREPGTNLPFDDQDAIPFFKGQTRTILGNNQHIDPIRVLDYLKAGGYAGLEKALGHDPSWIVDQVKRSGIRGRGGAGFPAGIKWELASKSEGKEKYIVCNADEGDPGAHMDRSLL
ncbi:MAG: NADH-quinone oxidoreductase subunit F, partial [Proteobacteria bacterium]|nr:NADH-quinone oxidoreductase subunit F [Pseudomonadota bacterium]